MPVIPQPGGCPACGAGSGSGGTHDVEENLLCDIGPDGEVLGTALAVYDYDNTTGLPIGPPTFRDPVTGLPYVPQGLLQPCPAAAGCGAPQRFCFVTSVTADVPGRMFDLSLDMGIGFAVTGIIKDLTVAPTNVLWALSDTTGTTFAAALQAAVQSQFAGGTVTVTPGVIDPCSGVGTFAIHIECFRLDQTPPTLVQLQYNGGRDLIINPAFDTTPPLPTFGFPKRADVPPSPVSQADVNCTTVANRGWETNDKSSVFEMWGNPSTPGSQANGTGTTPTPRGTRVQEINAFGSGATPIAGAQAGNPLFGQDPDTIWQTFLVPAAGNFTIKVVVGGRGQTNSIPVKLSTGDTGPSGIGDIINTVVVAPSANAELPNGVANPWTSFTQTVPLAPGLYTLAFTGPNAPDVPGGANSFGGLFTDMRVFQDAPGTVSDFVNNDDTCTVSVTSQNVTCEFWMPQCSNGDVVGWQKLDDGTELTNAAFWAQVPTPQCCETVPDAGGSGDAALGNLVHTYLVCGVTDTGTRTLSHVVYTDQNGAALSEQFVDTTGALVTPTSWQPGQCPDTSAAVVFAGFVCDGTPGTPAVPAVPDITYTDDFTGVATNPGPTPEENDFTISNFGGSGLSVLVAATAAPGDPAPNIAGPCVDSIGLPMSITLFFPAASINRQITLEEFSLDNGDQAAFQPNAPTIVSGPAVIAVTTVNATGPAGSTVVLGVDANSQTFQYNGGNQVTTGTRLCAISFTIPGTPAVPAVPATSVTVKQFRRADGTTFYENLDGTPHAIVGTIGECADKAPNTFGQVCFIPDDAQTISGNLATPTSGVWDTTTGFRTVNFAFGGMAFNPVTFDASVSFVQNVASVTLSPGHYKLDLGKIRKLPGIAVDLTGGATLANFDPAPITGASYSGPPIGLVWPDNQRFIEFDVVGTGTLDLGAISFENVRPGALVACDGCDGGVALFDLITGADASASIGNIVDCEAPGQAADDVTVTCGQVFSTGCYDDAGTIRSYVAIRDCTTGAIVRLDSATGVDVTANNLATCVQTTFFEELLCDSTGAQFVRRWRTTDNGLIAAPGQFSDNDLAGNAFIPVGAVGTCAGARFDVEIEQLCDATPTRFLRRYVYNATTGVIASITNTTLDGSTAFAPVGAVSACPISATVTTAQFDVEIEVLCDSTPTRFLRRYVYDAETPNVGITFTDTTLDGTTAFAPVGAVTNCPINATVTIAQFDVELQILCDATPTKFLRRYTYDAETPNVGVTITDTALDGVTPFAPVGAVAVCTTAIQSDFDFLATVLCDSNGTQFIQRLTFNSATGVVTATTNTTLTGAAFVPVGAISLCSNCCPVVIGQGCTNVGSLTYVAIRNTNGTISLLDAVTGAAILAANIVTCTPANGSLPATVAADHFDVLPGTPWTPAAIPAGRRLTGLSYTVLAGTVTTVDGTGATAIAAIPAGYSALWNVNDDRETLTAPLASITAAALSRAIVTMITAL